MINFLENKENKRKIIIEKVKTTTSAIHVAW